MIDYDLRAYIGIINGYIPNLSLEELTSKINEEFSVLYTKEEVYRQISILEVEIFYKENEVISDEIKYYKQCINY